MSGSGEVTLRIEDLPRLEAELADTPKRLAILLAGVELSVLKRQPRPDGFSLLETAWHLHDLEKDAWGPRIDRLLNEGAPEMDDFDGDAAARERRYHALPLAPALVEFAVQRTTNLMKLKGLRADQLARCGRLAGASITLGALLVRMRDHDRGHLDDVRKQLGKTR